MTILLESVDSTDNNSKSFSSCSANGIRSRATMSSTISCRTSPEFMVSSLISSFGRLPGQGKPRRSRISSGFILYPGINERYNNRRTDIIHQNGQKSQYQQQGGQKTQLMLSDKKPHLLQNISYFSHSLRLVFEMFLWIFDWLRAHPIGFCLNKRFGQLFSRKYHIKQPGKRKHQHIGKSQKNCNQNFLHKPYVYPHNFFHHCALNKIKKILDLNEIKIDGVENNVKRKYYVTILLIAIVLVLVYLTTIQKSNSNTITIYVPDNIKMVAYKSYYHSIVVEDNTIIRKSGIIPYENFTLILSPKIRQEHWFISVNQQNNIETKKYYPIPSEFQKDSEVIVFNNSGYLTSNKHRNICIFLIICIITIVIPFIKDRSESNE